VLAEAKTTAANKWISTSACVKEDGEKAVAKKYFSRERVPKVGQRKSRKRGSSKTEQKGKKPSQHVKNLGGQRK